MSQYEKRNFFIRILMSMTGVVAFPIGFGFVAAIYVFLLHLWRMQGMNIVLLNEFIL